MVALNSNTTCRKDIQSLPPNESKSWCGIKRSDFRLFLFNSKSLGGGWFYSPLANRTIWNCFGQAVMDNLWVKWMANENNGGIFRLWYATEAIHQNSSRGTVSWPLFSRERLLENVSARALGYRNSSSAKGKVTFHLVCTLGEHQKAEWGGKVVGLQLLLNGSCLIIFRMCWSFSGKILSLKGVREMNHQIYAFWLQWNLVLSLKIKWEIGLKLFSPWWIVKFKKKKKSQVATCCNLS